MGGGANAGLKHRHDVNASKSDETMAERGADCKFLRLVNEYDSADFKQCRLWLLFCRRICVRDKGADGQATSSRVAPIATAQRGKQATHSSVQTATVISAPASPAGEPMKP